MLKQWKRPYVPPDVLFQAEMCLERSLLASVVEDVAPVETAGQEINGLYDGANKTDPSKPTFNYDWGE